MSNGITRRAGIAAAAAFVIVDAPKAASAQSMTTSPASGQATAPSSITPDTLRPPETNGDGAALVPHAGRLTPPAGTGGLSVRISGLDVEGGFPEVAEAVRTIAARYANRTVTLDEIYAAASAIEEAHARAGYALVRVSVPPQTLDPGARVRIVVIDGFIEQVDASGVPARVRNSVLRRTGSLVGRRHLKLRRIEELLLIAGDAPGLALTSTLARGTERGGVRLLLSGRQALLSGAVSIANDYAASLGRWGGSAQLSLNSPLGRGEQFYGFASSGHDLSRFFADDPRIRVVGGGLVWPFAGGRVSLNPEAVASRTQPEARDGVPRTRGVLRRLSLRGAYTAIRTRRESLSFGAAVEGIRETNEAIDFDVRLSRDRFTVGRLTANYSVAFDRRRGAALTVDLSRGLGGARTPDPTDPSASAPSRQGANARFAKIATVGRLYASLPHRIEVSATVKAQTSFGKPLFRSEQTQLEGADALSAYVGGATAVDEALTGRVELARTWTPGRDDAVRFSPYVFAASGEGWIARPTIVEIAHLTLASLGAGLRGGVARLGVAYGLEYARGFASDARFDRADRLAIRLTKTF